MQTDTAANFAASTASAAGAALVVLGIPAGALAAALIGAGVSHVLRPREKHEAIPKQLVLILAEAFIGGWLAVAAAKVPQLQQYGVPDIPIEALAGLFAVTLHWIRRKAPDLLERAFTAVLSRIQARKGDKP